MNSQNNFHFFKHPKLKRAAIYCIVVLFSAFCMVYGSMLYTLHSHAEQILSYKKEDIDEWIQKERVDFTSLHDRDYEFLLHQTGLGRDAVDKIVRVGILEEKSANQIDQKGKIESKNCKTIYEKLSKAQEKNFEIPKYVCESTSIFSSNERFKDEEGKLISQYDLVDVRPGDVLVSMSTHTLGYRHGHCGIVINEDKILEAVYWGKPTKICRVKRWESCPTLLQLRVSEETAEKMGLTRDELGSLLADIAIFNGSDIRYSMFPNIFNYNCDTIKRTHCSHLVWYVFDKAGIDVDSDGGLIVTPWDIARSDTFEIVQIHGLDADIINK